MLCLHGGRNSETMTSSVHTARQNRSNVGQFEQFLWRDPERKEADSDVINVDFVASRVSNSRLLPCGCDPSKMLCLVCCENKGPDVSHHLKGKNAETKSDPIGLGMFQPCGCDTRLVVF